MKDRIIGYTVIVAVLFLLVIPVALIILQSASPKAVRQITFSSVKGLSFLSFKDPVRIHGTEVGLITAIDLYTNSAVITIETDPHINIYEGYSIYILAKGVMGERFLNISPGDSLKKVIPPSQMLVGYLSTGPDEALSYIGQLQSLVHQLNLLSQEFSRGTTGKKSLITKISMVIETIDTLSCTIASTVSTIDTQLQQTLRLASVALEQGHQLTASIDKKLPATILALDSSILVLSKICSQADTLRQQSDRIIAAVNQPDPLIWKNSYPTITEKLFQLQTLIGTLKSDSIEVPVRLW